MSQMSSREEVIAQDRRDLHGLGYAQELLRTMGGFSNFAISFSIISILTGAVILYNYGLNLAGPGAVGIGWPLVTFFTLMIAATMAEIASAYPTAGGLYYWASKLRNKNWGWWTAWLNLGGQISIVAGINYSAAFYLTATIINPLLGGTFDPTAVTFGVQNAIWVTGILIAIEVVFNVAGTRVVAFMNDLSVWWHIFFVAAIAIALLALGTQPTNDIGFLFTIEPAGTATDGTPWAQIIPFGIAGAFALSLLQSQWTYTGYDASAHVSEETVFARRASAWGVFLSVAVSAIAGYVVLMALNLKMRGGLHPWCEPGIWPRPARRPPGGGRGDRHDLLRVLVHRIGGPDAVRVQPRRWRPRQPLAEEGQPPLPHTRQLGDRDQCPQLVAHHAGVRALQGVRR